MAAYQYTFTFIFCPLFFLYQLQTDLHFDGMKDPHFDGQIAKEYMLEDVLKLLFPVCNSEAVEPGSQLNMQEETQKVKQTSVCPDITKCKLINSLNICMYMCMCMCMYVLIPVGLDVDTFSESLFCEKE